MRADCLCLIMTLITSHLCSTSSLASHKRRMMMKRAPKTHSQCPVDIKNCIEPITSKICSGQGACVCGQCACFQTDFERYYGRFCEHCDSCSPNLCDYLRPCVECRVHSSGQFENLHECEAHCSRFPDIQIAQVASSDEKDGHYFCSFKDKDECDFYFVYGYDAIGHLIIIAERDKECPVRAEIAGTGATSKGRESKRNGEDNGAVASDQSPSLQRPPPVLLELPSDPAETTSGSPGKGRSNKFPEKVRTPIKFLNTPAFDLMVVCGLTMTRHSNRTTQLPQYLQRTGIHFDLQNCQFIPKSSAFQLTLPQPPLSSAGGKTFPGPTTISPSLSILPILSILPNILLHLLPLLTLFPCGTFTPI